MPKPTVQAGLFKVPKAPVGQRIVPRQQSPKSASATKPKVKLAPPKGWDPEVSRCLNPLVGTAGSYLTLCWFFPNHQLPGVGGFGREGAVED